MNKIERFFAEIVSYYVQKFKYLIIIVFVIWAGVATYIGSQLQPIQEQEEFLPDDHPLTIVTNEMEENFGSSRYVLAVHIYWGVKDIDRYKTTMWDASYAGDVVWDEDFSIYSVEAQQSLLNFCEDLREYSNVLDGEVECWTDDF